MPKKILNANEQSVASIICKYNGKQTLPLQLYVSPTPYGVFKYPL